MLYTFHYNSLTDLVERVHLKPSAANKNLETAQEFRKNYRENYRTSGRQWYGMDTNNPGDVIDAIHHGYRPGLDSIRECSGQFGTFAIKSVKRRRIRGDQGDDLDIARVYSGHLDSAWSRTRRESNGFVYGKEVKIVVDIGANCHVKADRMKWRGAYAAALADAYVQAGYRVELYAYWCLQKLDRDGTVSAEFILKICDSAEPFDLEKLANTICFPGFFRTLGFESILTVPAKIDDRLGGHNPIIPSTLADAIVVKEIWSLEEAKAQVIAHNKTIDTEG